MDIASKIQEYYSLFKGIPSNNPIVRQSQFNDAFEIVVYDLLFRTEKYGNALSKENITELEKSIVPPPDDTIDIFYEEENGDDFKYHIVQVKNTVLQEADIKVCFSTMKRSINTYLNNRRDVNPNLRQIISDTNFDEDFKDQCIYYVVHRGSKEMIRGLKEDEVIITNEHLETILRSVAKFCVPFEKIKVDKNSNFLLYDNIKAGEKENFKACVCNINGYELAKLCNKYNRSELGRNILFGQNLREAIQKGSKTFEGMSKTIDEEPDNFWYYNNGITIITESYDLKVEEDVEYLELKNFSIINGAQTTSALAKYLKDAERDGENYKKANLRDVYVAARVVETKENDTLRTKITIFNNTQNPITTRDMISNNVEQVRLQQKYLDGGYPNIFVQIRTGQTKPKLTSFQRHQIIANNDLAQLVFASYLSSPFSAKEKRNTLFNNDNSVTDYSVNKEYSEIFNYSSDPSKCGLLFLKTKDEINELLFVRYIHNKAKKYLKDRYNEKIESWKRKKDQSVENSVDFKAAVTAIELQTKLKQINNINTFYNIALYYEFKRNFDDISGSEGLKFDFTKFYDKSTKYESEIVKSFAELFSSETITLIKNLGYQDPTKFVRAKASQDSFLQQLRESLAINISLQDKYEAFVTQFKS